MRNKTRGVGKIDKWDLVFAAGLIACVCLMLYKALMSTGDDDEHVLILNAFRLARGDRLLVDDWHMSHMSGIFLAPFLWVFHAVTGSCDGMVLYSRCVFIAVQAAVGAATYLTLRRYGRPSAAAASLVFFFNVPTYTDMVLYYNSTLCLAAQLCSLLLISVCGRFSFVKAVLAGVLFSVCVISSPYAAFIFLAYTLSVPVYRAVVKKRGGAFAPVFGFKCWAGVTLGVVLSAAVFAAAVLSRASLDELRVSIPMLLSDGDYPGGAADGIINLFSKYKKFFTRHSFAFIAPFAAAGGVLALVAAFDRGRKRRRCVYVLLACAWYAASVAATLLHKASLTVKPQIAVALPGMIFTLAGFVVYICVSKKNKPVYLIPTVLGLLAAFARSCESEMVIFAFGTVVPVCLTGAVMAFGGAARELFVDGGARAGLKKAAAVSLAVVTALELSVQAGVNVYPKFNDEYTYYGVARSEKLDTRISVGPLKGLYTTANEEKLYLDTLADLDLIKSECEGPVMVASKLSWAYLYMDSLTVGAFSGCLDSSDWLPYKSEKMKLYFKQYPERYPEFIYIPYYDNHARVYYLLRVKTPVEIQKGIFENVREDYPGELTRGKAGYIIRTQA
ncbi:MAG: hypothetical protein IJM45_10480 [Clostridia bacterium]|nr:hypothetical protein [Clostridia bacterium]